MSSQLIRQDLVPMVAGYVIVMATLAIGLRLQRWRASPPGPDDPGRDTAPPPGQRRAVPGRKPGWPRLIRHLAATELGGYVLLMAVVVLYYYGVARVSGSFLSSVFTGCATLLGISLPLFACASWLTERRRRDTEPGRAGTGEDDVPAREP